MKGSIYIIKNKINSKVYIGQTTLSVNDRFKQHMKPSAHKKSYKIYKAINKHGVENFYYEILEENISIDILDEREIYYIELYNSFKKGYNSTKGGDGRMLNKIEDINYVIDELKQGKLIIDIAKELEICTETITRALKSVGIDKPSSIQGVRIIESIRTLDREKIKEMYLKGYSHNAIASELKINQRSVSRVVKELKLENKVPRFDYSNIDIDGILLDIKNGIKRKIILEKYKINVYVYQKIKNSQKGNSNDYPEME